MTGTPAVRNQAKKLGFLGLCVLIIAAFAALAMLNLREPWSDEAMLAFNFVGQDAPVLQPLPFYEQAAPIGYVLLVRSATAGLDALAAFEAMRVLSLGAFCLGLMALSTSFVPRRNWVAAALFFGVVFANPWFWQYAVEIKHYSFEFLATSLIVLSGRKLALSRRPGAAVLYLVICAVAPVFAFTSPLVVVATGLAILTYRLVIRRGPVAEEGFESDLRRVVLVTGLAVIVAAAFHVLINRGLVQYQLAAYQPFYSSGLVDPGGSMTENIKILTRLPEYLLQPLGQEQIRLWMVGTFADGFALYAAIALGSFAVLLLILLLSFRSAPFVGLVTVIVLVLAGVLNILGMLAFSAYRHFFFLSPLVLLLAAFAGERVVGWIARRLPSDRQRMVGLAGLVALVVVASVGAWNAVHRRSPELLPVIDEITAADLSAPVWLYPSLQPMTLMVAPADWELLGVLDNRSGEVAWTDRHLLAAAEPSEPQPKFLPLIDQVADHTGPVWLIFPIVPGLDMEAYVARVQDGERHCTLRLETNGTQLFFCQ
ncbi:MAG: hypothetical protein GJ676_09595 [Rhodobacteraceae bacterium]|nr:hypothetical protein [Paracoccaceae bacterium]